jgi:hypothetical protein
MRRLARQNRVINTPLGGAMQELHFDDGIRFTAVVSSEQPWLAARWEPTS